MTCFLFKWLCPKRNVAEELTDRAMILYERYVPLRERIKCPMTREDLYNMTIVMLALELHH